MNQQKIIIKSLQDFNSPTISTEELMQEISARMIENNIKKVRKKFNIKTIQLTIFFQR